MSKKRGFLSTMSVPPSCQHSSWLRQKAHLTASPLEGKHKNRKIIQCSRFGGAPQETGFSLAWLKARLWMPGGRWEHEKACGLLGSQRTYNTSDPDNLLKKNLSNLGRGGGWMTHRKYRDDTSPQKVWDAPRNSSWADWWRSSPVQSQSIKTDRGGYFLKCKNHIKK